MQDINMFQCALVHIYIYMFIFVCACTGWRRLIGSLKMQIILHKRATKCMSLLRKMTYKDKGSYESSPPCMKCIYFKRCSYLHVWCIFMYLYIHECHAYVSIHMFTRLYMYTFISVCVFMICIYTHRFPQRLYTFIYMYICMNAMNIHHHINVHIRTFLFISTYVLDLHTHVQVFVPQYLYSGSETSTAPAHELANRHRDSVVRHFRGYCHPEYLDLQGGTTAETLAPFHCTPRAPVFFLFPPFFFLFVPLTQNTSEDPL